MAENVKKSGTESYPVTTGIIGEIKKWYWVLLAILSLTATAFYATAKITYKPVCSDGRYDREARRGAHG